MLDYDNIPREFHDAMMEVDRQMAKASHLAKSKGLEEPFHQVLMSANTSLAAFNAMATRMPFNDRALLAKKD